MTPNEQFEQAQYILEKIRPYLQRDGGDCELIEIKDGIAYLQLLGACVGCGSSDVTLKQGIELALVEEVPGIIGVEAINLDDEF